MICEKCGNELSQDDIFCGKCGQKVIYEAIQEEKTGDENNSEVIIAEGFGEANWSEEDWKLEESAEKSVKPAATKEEQLLRIVIAALIIVMCLQPWFSIPRFMEIRGYEWASVIEKLDYFGIDAGTVSLFGVLFFTSIIPLLTSGMHILSILVNGTVLKGLDICGLICILVSLVLSIQLKDNLDNYIFMGASVCEIKSSMIIAIVLLILQATNFPKEIAERFSSK